VEKQGLPHQQQKLSFSPLQTGVYETTILVIKYRSEFDLLFHLGVGLEQCQQNKNHS
jgi:hypothetical protein